MIDAFVYTMIVVCFVWGFFGPANRGGGDVNSAILLAHFRERERQQKRERVTAFLTLGRKFKSTKR